MTVTVNDIFPGKLFAYTVTGEVKVQFYHCYIPCSSCMDAEAAYIYMSSIGVGMTCTLGGAHSISCAVHVQYNSLFNT